MLLVVASGPTYGGPPQRPGYGGPAPMYQRRSVPTYAAEGYSKSKGYGISENYGYDSKSYMRKSKGYGEEPKSYGYKSKRYAKTKEYDIYGEELKSDGKSKGYGAELKSYGKKADYGKSKSYGKKKDYGKPKRQDKYQPEYNTYSKQSDQPAAEYNNYSKQAGKSGQYTKSGDSQMVVAVDNGDVAKLDMEFTNIECRGGDGSGDDSGDGVGGNADCSYGGKKNIGSGYSQQAPQQDLQQDPQQDLQQDLQDFFRGGGSSDDKVNIYHIKDDAKYNDFNANIDAEDSDWDIYNYYLDD